MPSWIPPSARVTADDLEERLRRERLRHVIVSALALAPEAIALRSFARDENDRDLRGLGIGLERARRLEAVLRWHDDVHEDQRRLHRLCLRDRFLTVRRV